MNVSGSSNSTPSTLTDELENVLNLFLEEGPTVADFGVLIEAVCVGFGQKHANELQEKNDKIAALSAALATKNEELAAKDEQIRVLERKKPRRRRQIKLQHCRAE